MSSIVEARGLVKKYGDVVALDGLDIDVAEGTVLALLGPNGTGKTTAVSILTTLLHPDEGSARIAGIDVLENPEEARKVIGLSGQNAAVDEHLSGFENLDMIGRLYQLGRVRARERARELLERFDLIDAADRPVKTYSGGIFPGTPEPTVWPLQNPVPYTLIWVVVIIAIFVPLAVHRYKTMHGTR